MDFDSSLDHRAKALRTESEIYTVPESQVPTNGSVSLIDLSQKRRKRAALSIWTVCVDLLCIAAAFTLASLGRLGMLDGDQLSRILVSVLPMYLGVALNNQTHQAAVLLDGFRSAWRASAAFLFAAASMLLIAFFMKVGADFSRLLFGFGAVLSVVLLIVWRHMLARIALNYLGQSPFANLCIYDEVPRTQASGEGSIEAKAFGLSADPNDPLVVERLARVAHGMDSVVVHCPPERRLQWAFMLKSLDVSSEIVVPELTNLRPLEIRQRSSQTSLVVGSGAMPWNQRVLKRGFDLIVTLAVMPILLPFLGLVAIVIKLDSPGPVFFKQDRIGLGNRKFKILKFRSMRTDMQDDNASKLTQRNDPRVTRVGEFIRKTSVDELPQVLNVLLGDMSLVGPRPHAELALAGSLLYWEVDNAYWHRHVVKPGITGLAQIRGHRGNTFEEQQLQDRLDADLEYVSSWSLISDIKILLRTAGVVLHKNAF